MFLKCSVLHFYIHVVCRHVWRQVRTALQLSCIREETATFLFWENWSNASTLKPKKRQICFCSMHFGAALFSHVWYTGTDVVHSSKITIIWNAKTGFKKTTLKLKLQVSGIASVLIKILAKFSFCFPVLRLIGYQNKRLRLLSVHLAKALVFLPVMQSWDIRIHPDLLYVLEPFHSLSLITPLFVSTTWHGRLDVCLVKGSICHKQAKFHLTSCFTKI